jgi:hypothetical protein
MTDTILLRGNLDEDLAIAFVHELREIRSEFIIIDIKHLYFAYPFGTLVVSSQIRHLQRRGQKFKLRGYDGTNAAHSYLGHMGFFQLINFDRGNDPGQASGSSTYVPLSILDKELLRNDDQRLERPIQDFIKKKSRKMAEVLTGSYSSYQTQPVAYCFRELIRNVFEHAHTRECILLAQSYGEKVHIAVGDYGRGLHRSLSDFYDLPGDVEAIKLAVKPGVSGTSTNPEGATRWSNSGFGLYVLSELGRRYGRFSVMTGDAMLHTSRSRSGWSVKVCDHRGTAVGLELTRERGLDLADSIRDIIREGESQAQTEGRRVQASRSSRDLD